jgi:hypothetical protein
LGLEDFLAAAALFGGGCVGPVFIVEFIASGRWRYILGSVVVLVVLGIWAHVAVGII